MTISFWVEGTNLVLVVAGRALEAAVAGAPLELAGAGGVGPLQHPGPGEGCRCRLHDAGALGGAGGAGSRGTHHGEHFSTVVLTGHRTGYQSH